MAPREPQPATKPPLANLLEQPLPVAVEAARNRFLRGPVRDVRQGDEEIVIVLDPESTSPVLIPTKYLGWKVRMVEG